MLLWEYCKTPALNDCLVRDIAAQTVSAMLAPLRCLSGDDVQVRHCSPGSSDRQLAGRSRPHTCDPMLSQGMVSMMVGIAKHDGAAGFFRGLGPTIVTNAPYSAFYYLFYTSLKERLQQVRHVLQIPQPNAGARHLSAAFLVSACSGDDASPGAVHS